MIYYLPMTLWANISGPRKDRENTQHALESWTSQVSRENKILKIGAWVTELFYFLCSYSDFVLAHTFFSHNSQANISGSRKDREDTQHASESWTYQLSREKRFWKSEHGLQSYFIFVQLLRFCQGTQRFFSHNSHVSESISKIIFSSESLAWQLSEEKKILKIGS